MKWEGSLLASPITERISPVPSTANKAITCEILSGLEEKHINMVTGSLGLPCDLGLDQDDNSINLDNVNSEHSARDTSSQHSNPDSPLFGVEEQVTNIQSNCSNNGDIGSSSPQQVYKCNIVRPDRNKNFNKIVHDTRNEQSFVYGLTEDLIISVDEKAKKYVSWAVHDRYDNQKCAEVYELIHKWPHANNKKCQYGIFSLNAVLPEVVESEQERYGEPDKQDN